MERKEIGIGMLGGGFMCKAHSNAYRTIPYMFVQMGIEPKLAIVCTSNVQSAQKAAERYGYARYSANADDLFNNAEVEAVNICTPDDSHVPFALKAVQAGKSVLCEKPMALSAKEGYSLYKAAFDAGVVNMVSFNYRFLPAVMYARQMIQSGELGQLYHMDVRYFQQGGANPEQCFEDTWYSRSGVLQGIGTHAIDQARFLMGEIASLSGLATVHVSERPSKNGGVRKMEIEDSARAVVTFVSGATGTIECSCMAAGRSNGLSWEINGSKGSLLFDLTEPNHLWAYFADDPKIQGFQKINVTQGVHPYMDIWWPSEHNIGWEHGHINLIAHFLSCVTENSKIPPLGATFEDGFVTALIVDAIRKSDKTGERIDLLRMRKDIEKN